MAHPTKPSGAAPKSRIKSWLLGCGLSSALLLTGAAFLGRNMVASWNQKYLDFYDHPSPDGKRDLVLLYKRNGMDVSRTIFVRDAPPQNQLRALGRTSGFSLAVWSRDSTVVALADMGDKGGRYYVEAYDFRAHRHWTNENARNQAGNSNAKIAALLLSRGGAAAPASPQHHEITLAEQDKWRALEQNAT